jgi:conjugal transfer ATP-binding protein TraC
VISRQIEEQLAKLGIRKLPPQELVPSRRGSSTACSTGAGRVSAQGDAARALAIRKQIIDAGPSSRSRGRRCSSAIRSPAA